MGGKLIVLESGTDASGKATQAKKLHKRLLAENIPVHKVEYPDYKSDSSALIKMYLRGEFGEKAEDINPYAVSTFFSVDRYASYQKKWKKLYKNGEIIIADRYTTSNMVYQGAKYDDIEEKQKYINWLRDLEFKKFSLPFPDCVLFLNIPPEISINLMQRRFVKKEEKDIHEMNYKYQYKTYKTACWLAEKFDWYTINCTENGKIKTREQIHEEIYEIVKNILKD